MSHLNKIRSVVTEILRNIQSYLFIYIFCRITDTDTDLVMLTWQAQLPTLGEHLWQIKQNPIGSYR